MASWTSRVEDAIEDVQGVLLVLVANVTAWISPAPSAWFVYHSAQENLGMGLAGSLVAALAIECMGVATMHAAMRMRQWNSVRSTEIERQGASVRPRMPEALAWVLTAFYLVATSVIIVFLKVIPDAYRFAPAIFPLAALAGTGSMIALDYLRRAERAHSERPDVRTEEEEEMVDKRVVKRPAHPVQTRPPVAPPAGLPVPAGRPAPPRPTDRVDEAIRAWVAERQEERGTKADLARQLGISRSTLNRRIKGIEGAS